MKHLRRHRRPIGWLMIVLMFLWLPQSQGLGVTLFWAPGGDPQGFGFWDTTSDNWRLNPGSGGAPWNNAAGNIAVFGDAVNHVAPMNVLVNESISANGIQFDAPG